MMPITRWDALVFARATVSALCALAVAVLVTAVTDEGSVPWLERLGRSLPFAPVCGAIGTWAALAPVASRGEGLGLAALGASPARVGGPAFVGSAVMTTAAAALIASVPSIEVTGFYPTLSPQAEWRPAHELRFDGFENATDGIRVDADGAPTRIESSLARAPARSDVQETPSNSKTQVPAQGRAAAAVATEAAGFALALFVARITLAPAATLMSGTARGRARRLSPDWVDAGASGFACLATLLLFQAAAARRAPALAATGPMVALLILATIRGRTAR